MDASVKLFTPFAHRWTRSARLNVAGNLLPMQHILLQFSPLGTVFAWLKVE